MDKILSFEQWVLENKSEIEKAAAIAGKGCTFLASTVGEFNPILKIVFQATSLLLNDPESKEGQYLSEQFLNLDQNLDALKNQIAVILQQIPFYSMNLYCDHEASIIFQYEMFMDFVHASPEYKRKKKDLFLSQFRANKGDLPLTTLYDGITDGSILKTMLAKEEWNRKAVQVFCTKLKMLFLKGVIVVIVYSALKPSEEREVLEVKTQAGDIFVDKAEVTMWLQKMEDVESPHTVWLFNWIAGTEYHDHSGSDNFFEIKTKDKIVVFSFSKERTCIDKDLIKKNIKRQQSRWNMADMTRSLSKSVKGKDVVFKPLLKVYGKHYNYDYEKMRNYCSDLWQLFCMGLTAAMVYTAIDNDDLNQAHNKWCSRMEEIAEEMTKVLDECKKKKSQE
ncbi:hypothetical protein GN956_G26494 [Arapaima gigas]